MYNILKLGTMQKSISKLNKFQYSKIMSYYKADIQKEGNLYVLT